MNIKYAVTKDKAKIAYQTFGKGPAIVLMHGSGRDKSMWLENGWVDVLKDFYTVIIIDIRGCGDSTKSYDSEFYSIKNILSDIEMVTHDCGFEKYDYFGHSYGATIGLQLCSQSKNVRKAICAGTCFGDKLFKVILPEWISEYDELNIKKKENKLEDLNLTPEDLEWANATDFELMLAQFRGWTGWPGIEPKDIKTSLAVYTGTDDTKEALEDAQTRKNEFLQYNIRLNIFEQLNHGQLVREIKVVLPWIREYLEF